MCRAIWCLTFDLPVQYTLYMADLHGDYTHHNNIYSVGLDTKKADLATLGLLA